VFPCAGAGLPGDGGDVAMVTESDPGPAEGQADREDSPVAGSESNCTDTTRLRRLVQVGGGASFSWSVVQEAQQAVRLTTYTYIVNI